MSLARAGIPPGRVWTGPMELLDTVRSCSAAAALVSIALAFRTGPRDALTLTWAAFCASIFCAMAGAALVGRAGPLGPALQVLGAASCGWFWLFSRALFRAKDPVAPVHVLVVLAIIMPTLIEALLTGFAGGRALDPASSAARMLLNAQGLLSSTVLIMCFWEALGDRETVAGRPPEAVFRLLFLAAYATGIAVSILWPNHSPDASLAARLELTLQAACSLIFVGVSGAAVWYRRRHPLPAQGPARAPARGTETGLTVGEEERALARRIEDYLAVHDLYLEPTLKVADLAAALGEPDYRVTRAITGVLGHRNFNQFINAYRLETAKRLLADPGQDHRSILAISMDSGFGSVGPFNRAFKASVGMTPGAYRAAARAGAPDAAPLVRPAHAQV